MKFFVICACMLFPVLSHAQDSYYHFFNDSALQVDYLLGGTDSVTEVFVEQMKKEPYYSGARINLIDTKDYGTFRYQAFDEESGKLIFSKGFCPLFQEWQTTDEAKSMRRSFYQAALLPFPKKAIRLTVDRKNWDGTYKRLISVKINPNDYFILNEKVAGYEYKEVLKSGAPEHKVDLVFLPEGYTKDEMGKFMNDVSRMMQILFAAKPFDRHKSDFNIYAVMVPSVESGTDIPGEHIYRNTAFNSTFYTFDTPRYLTTTDMKDIYDAAAVVPYDQIYVLVNSKRYGGGGFYNFLTVSTVDNEKTPQVLVHEFGHAFAGLADEYYSSSVAYENYYNLKIEPWEPNITTLVDFGSKWKDMLEPGTPVPTPRENQYKGTLGVFEGGGYLDKGIYSPEMDCRMKSNEASGFCPVCQRAIERAIDWYCK